MRYIALVIILVLTDNVMAQNAVSSFTVKGIVVDSVTKESEPYATINVVKKESPANPVKMMITNTKGRFQEKVPGAGNFTMTISSMGRNNIVKDFTVATGQKTIDLDTLYISNASNMLKGVEIVSQKPLVKADIDKITYNMEDDPDSKSNSVLEMLRKVPLVTVDGEEKIKVNGSSSFKIYVNGKPNNMMSNNPTDVLKSMPANSIKRIEVITNPGPKYDAEGVGGILNIITVGSGFEGYTVTASGNASNRGAGAGLFGTVKKGKLTVSANYNYNYNNSPRGYSGGNRKAVGNVSETSSNLYYDGTSKNHGNYQSGSMEASYEIDTLRLVTVSFGLWGGGSKDDGQTNTLATSPITANELYKYSSLTNSDNSWYSIDGGVDYQRLFHVKDRMLTLSYKINTNPSTNDSYSDYNDMSAVPDWQDFLNRMKVQHNDGSQNTTEQTFQIDYTTPIGKMHTVEAGAKYILRDNKSENDRYERLAGKDDYEFNENQSSHYKHQNDILAAYLGYGLKIKKFSGRLGLRYEHTKQDVKYLLGRGNDFNKDFNDMVPSVSVGYKLTDMSNLRLGYNLRIYRPGIWYLNPYLDDSNPTDISQGNSSLESEKSHSFNLSYSNFTSKLNFNLSLRYSFTNNSIEHVSTLIEDTKIEGLQNPTGKDVLYSTYQNIGKSRSANISGYVNWNITTTTRIYANLYGGYSYLNDGKDLKNEGWMAYVYGGIQQSLPKDWRISFNSFGQTPWVTLQGKGSSYFDYSMSVNKSFMDKRLTISAFASNFLKKYMRSDDTLESSSFIQDSWSKYSRQRFGVSISYRIGELKASVKKASRTISNDDVKGGGNSGGGGGSE